MRLKPKKCKNPSCLKSFMPKRSSLEPACSLKCAIEIENNKKWKAKKAKWTEELMTHKDYVKKLQPIFNKYIRFRDRNKNCISCDKVLAKKYDAGHCFPAGHYANLRFDEDNVHGQCVECNQHLHGNQAEYLLRLADRIGEMCYARLLKARNIDSKYSIIELKAMIIKYREKIKMIEGKTS